MVALYRPEAMDSIPTFVARKHSARTHHLPAPRNGGVPTRNLRCKQATRSKVMLLARKLANFTRGESDTLHKAMGKKLEKEMNLLKDKFISGGANQRVPPQCA